MKRIIIALCLTLLMATGAAAGESRLISITQIVEHPSLDAMRQGFKDRIVELGINAEFKEHIAQGNPATSVQIANQIKGEQPDLVLAITTPSAQHAVQKIKDRPIVFTGVTDPVGAGIVAHLDKPGANVTGMTDMSPMHKHLNLVQDFVPELESLGVIYNAGEPNSVTLINLLKGFAKEEGVTIEEATIANSSGVYQAAKSLVGRADAIYIPLDNTAISALESAIKVCRQNRIPLFTGDTDSVRRGSIAALAIDYREMGIQTADIAARILNEGAEPSEMPVETIKRLQLYVNPGAAESMGLEIPAGMLEKADEVVK